MRENSSICELTGIATEENLSVIVDKGYDYVCVERSDLKRYEYVQDNNPICVTDNRKQLKAASMHD